MTEVRSAVGLVDFFAMMPGAPVCMLVGVSIIYLNGKYKPPRSAADNPPDFAYRIWRAPRMIGALICETPAPAVERPREPPAMTLRRLLFAIALAGALVPRGTAPALALVEPGPCLAIGDVRNGADANPVFICYGRLPPVTGQQAADVTNLFFIKNCLRKASASGGSPMLGRIGGIFQACDPAKVAREIVKSVPIPMSDLGPPLWSVSMERGTDEAVNVSSGIGAERDGKIPNRLRYPGAQKSPTIRSAPLPGYNFSVQAAHAPETANLVSRVVRDQTPFFRLGIEIEYHLVSHDALLKRFGQAPAWGGNPASALHSTGTGGHAPC